VFLYLSSVVPAIWLLELDKVERRNKVQVDVENFNFAAAAGDLKELDKLLGMNIKLPDIQVDAETWVTLIEQFLMLVLIIGRWLLPKGDLTRDQLSQLLLVYIGESRRVSCDRSGQTFSHISRPKAPLPTSLSSSTRSRTQKYPKSRFSCT
jgi:Transmembrane protein 26